MKGWIITCFKGREPQTKREILQYLETFMSENSITQSSVAESSPRDSKTTHIETKEEISFQSEFDTELLELQQKSKRSNQRLGYSQAADSLFQVVALDVPCVLLVAFPEYLQPVCLALSLYNQILSTGHKTLYKSQRILPLDVIVPANRSSLLSSVSRLLDTHPLLFCPLDYSPSTPLSYANMPKLIGFNVDLNMRYNDPSLDKNRLKEDIAALVLARWSPKYILASKEEPFGRFKVDLSEPEVTILVEIVKHHAGMSIIQRWIDFKKGNVHLLYDKYLNKNLIPS